MAHDEFIIAQPRLAKPNTPTQYNSGDQGHGAAGPVPAPQQVRGAARRLGRGRAEGQGRHGADLPPRRQGGPDRAPGHPGTSVGGWVVGRGFTGDREQSCTCHCSHRPSINELEPTGA